VRKINYLYQTGQGWSSQTFPIDTLEDLSLAVDAAGQPHIAYVGYDDLLHYATWDGSQWQQETAQPLADYPAPSAVSIALDSQGRPVIAFQSGSGIRYTSRTDQGWTLEYLNNDAFGRWLSLALDDQDVPHLAYYDTGQDRQMYATRPAGSWLITLVDDDADTGHFTDLALDQQGQPHISYAYYAYFQPGSEFHPATELRYARLTAGQWLTETAQAGTTHHYPLLAIDNEDQLHAIYQDRAHSQWYYIYQTQSGWASEPISLTTTQYPSVAFTLDSAGNPRIAYYDSEADLRYAYRTNVGWFSQLVTAAAGAPSEHFDVSLALDTNDAPHILYHHLAANELQYAHLSGDQWVIETVTKADIDASISLAVDSLNQPHAAYEDETTNQLSYAYRQAGQWFMEAIGDYASHISLALDSQDNPHIVYWHGNQLSYIYWTGSVWSDQVITSPAQYYPLRRPSFALDQDDHPRVAYIFIDKFYYYVRFAHHDGANWLISHVDGGWGTADYPDLAFNSQGIPFILYLERLNGHLKLARPAVGITYSPLTLKSQGGTP
jgi:hypothetical protein